MFFSKTTVVSSLFIPIAFAFVLFSLLLIVLPSFIPIYLRDRSIDEPNIPTRSKNISLSSLLFVLSIDFQGIYQVDQVIFTFADPSRTSPIEKINENSFIRPTTAMIEMLQKQVRLFFFSLLSVTVKMPCLVQSSIR
jgi:hypothetical protein